MKYQVNSVSCLLIIIMIFIILVIYLFYKKPVAEETIEGTYKLISGEHHQKDGDIIIYPIGNGIHYKIFLNGYYSTNWDDISPGHSSIYPGYNFGKYFYSKHGDFYTTIAKIHIHENLINYKEYFKARFEQNNLLLSPSDENGVPQEVGFFERWEKIE